MSRAAKRRTPAPAWKWMRVSDLRNALRWPWDHTNGGKYGAQNDNGWVLLGGVWTHQADVESTRVYWRRHGWGELR